MWVKVKRLYPSAKLPVYGTTGAACFDLHACLPKGEQTLNYGKQQVGTGLAFEVPEGWALLLYSRSGHGAKNTVRLGNCTGVIDSDYRGEVKVNLYKDDPTEPPLKIKDGDRIAQGMLIPINRVEFLDAGELTDTERGTGGHGSTGQ